MRHILLPTTPTNGRRQRNYWYSANRSGNPCPRDLGIEARSVVQRIFADIEIHELVDGGQIPAYFVRLHDVVAVQVAVTQQHSVQGVLVVIGQTVVLGGVEHLRPMQGSVGYIVFAQNTTYGIEPAVAGGSTVSHVTFLPTRALHAAFKPPCGGQFILALFTLYTVRMDFCLKVCMASTTLDAPSGL